LTQEVHNEFHAWNGGSQKLCTAELLIEFVSKLYPDNYEVVMRINESKKILDTKLPA
jgi:hypothetical protein